MILGLAIVFSKQYNNSDFKDIFDEATQTYKSRPASQ